jgi:hypothetical protein
MKKLVFAVQVFGIIALFPIYVILEMNHGIERSPGNINPRVAKEIIDAPALSLNADVQKGISIPVKILLGSTVLPGKDELIKALAEKADKPY